MQAVRGVERLTRGAFHWRLRRVMGIASIVLGALSLLCAVGGFLATPIPILGALLSFASPVLALAGIVLGGVGLSKGREEGGDTGTATAGLVVSIIAFIPAFFVALLCGVCNSLCTASMFAPPHPGATPWIVDAGGHTGTGHAAPMPLPDPNAPAVPAAPVDPNTPPPAFPPPPAP